ncbi:uncharacterized protein LOC110869983 [Helianthus annuus]|uniref:uncharacterized protein LOC110869983 n=1 Tax=Helianthus annuus TaxID=4232 RepID=UPI000B8FFCF7|nr:uncharacterized protein LOC110869983 [Helianthus annuus]
MAGSDEANSHPAEGNNTRIKITGVELQAMITAAVTQAVDAKFKEPSVVRSQTHSKSHSHSHTHKKREKGAIDCMKWLDEMEIVIDISECAKEDIVMFVSQSFKGDALTWWKALVQATRKVPLYNLSWNKFVDLVKDTYCPQHEVERIETDFLTLVMKDLDCRSYMTSFNSMSRLVPYLVTPEPKRIARFIGGLAPEVKGNVKASKPATYRSAVDLSLSLTLDVVRSRAKKVTDEGKRKREEDKSPQSNKKGKGNSGSKKGQSNDRPRRKICHKRHFGKCNQDPQAKPCGICKKKGHKSVECRNIKDATCYGCNEKGHIKTNCPKNAKKPEEAKKYNARVFQMNAKEAVNDENVITGMDWLSHNQAQISCDKKLVIIKTPSGESVTIQGYTQYGLPSNVSILKVSQCLKSGCVIYMAQVSVNEPKPKIEDIPIISEYLDVFPDELPGLPPERQVEFRIDILPGSAPIARAPYRLAPTEMKELRTQLDDLLEKGFIHPSSSPWAAPIL